MIGEYPSAGAVHVRSAVVSRGVAVKAPGTAGRVYGVMGLVGADAGPDPAALDAVTVNVYAVPGVRSLMLMLRVSSAAEYVAPPGDAVTVYPFHRVITRFTGGSHRTTADCSPALAAAEGALVVAGSER